MGGEGKESRGGRPRETQRGKDDTRAARQQARMIAVRNETRQQRRIAAAKDGSTDGTARPA